MEGGGVLRTAQKTPGLDSCERETNFPYSLEFGIPVTFTEAVTYWVERKKGRGQSHRSCRPR
jgi:hypothetical protein